MSTESTIDRPVVPGEVIILGCGPTRVECQYHTEVWGVNGTYMFCKRLDKLFMTDEVSEIEAENYDIELMRRLGCTFVFPVAYPKLSNLGIPVEIFPINEILHEFDNCRFFSNTIAYQIAYALLKGYKKIYLYGIDMMTNSTYIQEKGGVEFWMGVALGRGVRVINTSGSATGKSWNGKMYGHYGQLQEEVLKERLMAPWESVRIAKRSNPQDEWVKVNDAWTKIPADHIKDSAEGIPNVQLTK